MTERYMGSSHMTGCVPICLCICLSMTESVRVCQSATLELSLSSRLSVCLSVCLSFISLTICLTSSVPSVNGQLPSMCIPCVELPCTCALSNVPLLDERGGGVGGGGGGGEVEADGEDRTPKRVPSRFQRSQKLVNMPSVLTEVGVS